MSINIPCLKNGIKNKLLRQTNYKNGCPYLTTLVSGSPIIQNGKLVGAVTHVLIGDPTTGYGIFIDNMLRDMPELLK